MNFNSLQFEIKEDIINFMNPESLSRDSVKACASDIVSLSLTSSNQQVQVLCKKNLSALKEIYELLNKYSKYQDSYEDSYKRPWKDWETGEAFDAKGNPQLYDALLTGCKLPYAISSFNKYNEEIEDDIKKIVKLMPQSLNCIIGNLRCREKVTPLFAACINTNIPIHIVEFLLQNGANSSDTILVNNVREPIFSDLNKNVPEERFSQIRELFLKYGFEK